MIFQKTKSTLKENVWGGHKLAAKYGKGDFSPRRIAESWERCELLDQLGFQLKWIDTDFPTSVQVHPGLETTTQTDLVCDGGSEIWVVVESESASRIGIGFNRTVTQEEILDAIHNRTLGLYLNTVHPKPGDCFVIPSGTIHYIDSGVTILEWKQKNAQTFRLYDWGRETISDRTLQIVESLAAIHFESSSLFQTHLPLEPGGMSVVVSLGDKTFHFGWRQVAGHMTLDGGGVKFLTCLEGTFLVDGTIVQKGETVQMPFDSADSARIFRGNGILLETLLHEKKGHS